MKHKTVKNAGELGFIQMSNWLSEAKTVWRRQDRPPGSISKLYIWWRTQPAKGEKNNCQSSKNKSNFKNGQKIYPKTYTDDGEKAHGKMFTITKEI